jgi:hypothetical protein
VSGTPTAERLFMAPKRAGHVTHWWFCPANAPVLVRHGVRHRCVIGACRRSSGDTSVKATRAGPLRSPRAGKSDPEVLIQETVHRPKIVALAGAA